MIPHYRKFLSRAPLAIVLFCAVVVGLLLGNSIWMLVSGESHKSVDNVPGHTPTGDVPSNTKIAVSPLLFGTNLSLYNENDQFLTSAITHTMLQHIHMRIIRMPIRSGVPEAVNIQAAQTIRSLGAIPLIILHGAVDFNALADDTLAVNDMNRIFGKDIVYYEFGNENDLQGVSVDHYTAAWNSVIPQLKHLAFHGQFVGPVNFQYERNYLTAFLQHAHPRPDEVSWHEYTCDDAQASDVCISHIAHWTNHIQDARSVMMSTTGTELPIMITEWNYAPNAVPNDDKNNNSTFMRNWTARALQTLAANRVFASMQYACTHPIMPLITSTGTLTVQGATFEMQYQQMILDKQLPGVLS